MRAIAVTSLALAAFLLPQSMEAQEPGIKIAVGDVGLGIGDVPRLDGLRLNFRDLHLVRARGVNATIWMPYDESRGAVQGLALGLPLTGARTIEGVALGLGVGVEQSFAGVGFAPIGLGAGGPIRGIAVAGVGIGSGGDVEGVMVGGVGLGSGGDIRGIAVGGVGGGASGDLTGLAIGGVGFGVGGNLTGIALGGVGVGVGGELKGLAVSGIGAGASRISGVVLAGVGAGAETVRGVVIAPAYFKVTPGGTLRGVSVSAFNDLRQASQHGLTIGLLNIAEELHGVQIGLINIARNKRSFSVLPLVNYHR